MKNLYIVGIDHYKVGTDRKEILGIVAERYSDIQSVISEYTDGAYDIRFIIKVCQVSALSVPGIVKTWFIYGVNEDWESVGSGKIANHDILECFNRLFVSVCRKLSVIFDVLDLVQDKKYQDIWGILLK